MLPSPGAASTPVSPIAPAAAPRMRLCLVAHLAYQTLAGAPGRAGGVEYQTSLLARWMAARGHHVTLVTWDEGQAADTVIDGVRIVTVCCQADGVPGLRFFAPRWTSLRRALRLADAAIYYQNGAEYVTGQVALWCRANRRRFVFSSASNSDCDPQLPLLTTWRERMLYRLGLGRAHRIIVQTRTQQESLHRHFGHPSVVLPMPCVDTSGGEPIPGLTSRPRILWIGRVCQVKRPDRLLDLATHCPELAFDLVGLGDGSPYADSVFARSRNLPNVTVHGATARERIGELMREAACLCCTSDIEGFPNTYLEAWSHGVPVVSTFDPDGMVATRGLGWTTTPDRLADRLRAVLTDPRGWSEASERSRRYYRDHHTMDAVMPQFESLFATVVAGAHA